MSDFQFWAMNFTIICTVALLCVYRVSIYAIMRATEKYISNQQNRERDM